MLNAFRHHRGRHHVSAPCVSASCTDVLNAFRHHRGRHLRHRCHGSAPRIGAQRLSASQRWACARASHADSGPHDVCSTPFGITEVGTLAARRECVTRMAGAQRLSASQRSALRHANGDCPARRRGAQRLSASQRSARGLVTSARWPFHGAQRLSASQRSARRPARQFRSYEIRCSTPFGITEVGIAARPSRSAGSPSSAQRLSASQRSALTFRGCRICIRACAQRLSASQRWALSTLGLAVRCGRIVCSTPFGITEVGTSRASAQ